jgi:hypothetical protein
MQLRTNIRPTVGHGESTLSAEELGRIIAVYSATVELDAARFRKARPAAGPREIVVDEAVHHLKLSRHWSKSPRQK